MRRNIAADILIHDLHLVSFKEKHGPMSTRLDVSVTGHPRRIREFHDHIRNDYAGSGGGGGFDDLIFAFLWELFVTPALRAIKRSWQGRNDPPIEQTGFTGLHGTRAIVTWTYTGEDASGEPVGAVSVESYTPGNVTPGEAQHWPEPVSRSLAQAFAAEHDHILIADE